MSFFEDQEDAWFDGGKEWYESIHGCVREGIPGDFDPHEFWAETTDD